MHASDCLNNYKAKLIITMPLFVNFVEVLKPIAQSTKMLENLLEELDHLELVKYSSLLINLYEDDDMYTAEACLDDEKLIIGRDNPFLICDSGLPWEKVLKEAGKILKKYIKDNHDKYKHFNSISFGFVDGDEYFIKKHVKKHQPVNYSAEDFMSFSPEKLYCWLTVYSNKNMKDQYGKEIFELDYKKMTDEQKQYWSKLLAENFNYEMYYDE